MLKILVVDDDELFNTTFSLLLESIMVDTYKINSLHTGSNIVEEIEKQKYDIVFLDNKLPGKNGLSIIKELNRKNIDTSIVLLTGSDDMDIMNEALKLGAVDFVAKGNFDINRINEALNKAAHRKDHKIEINTSL